MNQWHCMLLPLLLSAYFSGKLGLVMTPLDCFVKLPPHSATINKAKIIVAKIIIT